MNIGTALGAGTTNTQPCNAAMAAQHSPFTPHFSYPDQEGKPEKPTTSVNSYSTPGCSAAVLKGEHGSAHVGGDAIELRDGAVYVNGVSYGAVTPEQTIEYDVTREKRTLTVDGKVRTPAH